MGKNDSDSQGYELHFYPHLKPVSIKLSSVAALNWTKRLLYFYVFEVELQKTFVFWPFFLSG